MMDRTPRLDNLNLHRLDFPEDVIVETCSYCNLHCPCCPQSRLARRRGIMAQATFERIADEVRLHAGTRLWLGFMGEPLYYSRQSLAMARYAAGVGCEVHLNTNGQYLDEYDNMDRVLDAGIRQVVVSVDAATEETYRALRPGGEFRRVVANVERLLERIGLIECRGSQVMAIYGGGLAFRCGPIAVPEIVCQMIVQDANAAEVDEFTERWTALGATVKLRLKAGWGNATKAEERLLEVPRTFPCPWLVRAVVVLWDGRAVMCDGYWDGEGAQRHESIAAAWRYYEGEREKQWHGVYDGRCAECVDWAVGRSRFYYPDGRVE